MLAPSCIIKSSRPEVDRSLIQIFRGFFPKKVWLMINVSEGILFQNHEIPTYQNWATIHDVTMTS